MKKKLFFIIPLSVLFIAFAISINKNVNGKSNNINADNINTDNLIAEIADEAYLYYDKKTLSGMFDGFYLKTNDKEKLFDWESIDKPAFYPTISLTQNDYIAIILTIGEGSGVNIQQLHLINKNTLEEINYINPIDVVEANITSVIEAPDVTISIKNNKWHSTFPTVKNISNFFENIYYENVIRYAIQDNSFSVTLSAQITPALFIGDFKITYLWNEKKSEFIPTSINFNFYDSEIK